MSNLRFRTELIIGQSPWPIARDSSIMLAGSCFTTGIGTRLTAAGFNTMVNPSGTLYNPASIATMLHHIMAGKNETVRSTELIEHEGAWHSFDHHTSFSHPEKSQLLKAISESTDKAHEFLLHATHLIVTFGTAYVFTLADSGRIVANCHKQPARIFNRRKLISDEIVGDWKSLIAELLSFNPNLKIIFTVSPIRHTADGLHGNQLSKATLLLAIDRLCETFPQSTTYFPAYEAVIDDLRDYRFYAADMVHPTDTAVDYVYSLFSEAFFSSQTAAEARLAEKQARRLLHRPINKE